MNVRQLKYFLAVADRKSFSRAAEELWIATSPLSRSIKDLERDLGVQLLERSTRGVRLTPAGKALVPKATEIVRLVDNLPLELGGVTSATLTIGLSPAVADDILLPLTELLETDLEGLAVVWQPGLAGTLVEDLHHDRIDAAVFPLSDSSASGLDGSLNGVALGPGAPMGVLMLADDVLTRAERLSLTDFEGRHFAIPARSDPASMAAVRETLRRSGVASVEAIAEHLALIPGFVTHRGWYSIARIDPQDPWTTYYRSQGLVVCPVTENLQTFPGFVWSRRRAGDDPTVARAVAVARAWVRPQPDARTLEL